MRALTTQATRVATVGAPCSTGCPQSTARPAATSTHSMLSKAPGNVQIGARSASASTLTPSSFQQGGDPRLPHHDHLVGALLQREDQLGQLAPVRHTAARRIDAHHARRNVREHRARDGGDVSSPSATGVRACPALQRWLGVERLLIDEAHLASTVRHPDPPRSHRNRPRIRAEQRRARDLTSRWTIPWPWASISDFRTCAVILAMRALDSPVVPRSTSSRGR